ncbi:Sentrin-specific protease 2, partial [Leptosomus discolor]
DAYLNVPLILFSFAVGVFSASRKHHIKPVPDNILTLRPPIKERPGPESTPSEVSKMGRLFCAAEEDVQREEKEKYQQLLQLVKEKYPGSRPILQPTSFRKHIKLMILLWCFLLHPSVQASSQEPVMPVSHLEIQKYGGDVYPCATLRTSECPHNTFLFHSVEKPERLSPLTEVPELTLSLTWQTLSGPVALSLGLDVQALFLLKAAHRSVCSGLCFPSPSPFNCSLQAMEREVAAAFGPGEPDEILSSAFKLNITREDICTLRHLRWLNDEVINFYLMLLSERSKKTGYPAIHVFSTFFYTKLVSGGYQIVRRWTRSIDLFKQDIVLVPVHLRAHWALVAIDMRKKTIRYFDSFGQNGGEICATLFQYLQEEHREKRRLDLPPSEWTLHSMEPHEIPQQFNGSDCGVFVCQYANHISRDQPLTFTQSHMPYFRRKMVWE